MASFGRLTVSAITGNNENTFALASINADFSLLKITPPKEFLDVGNSLSIFRKEKAEQGDIHRTARKLGAIFEPILPPTPHLLRQYGTRASQIARSTAKSIPKPQGIFRKQSGIDGTSIWAAATSSSGALQVHLLACMLARIWEQKDAVSIWEELLKGRQMQIEETFQAEGSMSMAACSAYLASLQTITRTQIGEWDDSARAWLRIADRSPIVIVKQNQLGHIVDNTKNFVNNRPSLYDSVVQAWQTALQGTERLLDGSPQQMQTGEILLGLHAWHIYPDINLVGDTKVFSAFADPLVPASGILTIGLVGNADPTLSKGLHWSLPLAHLRYYGDPIEKSARLSGVRNRISFPEFMQTILGALLGYWGTDESITENVLKWIICLHGKLSESAGILPNFHMPSVKGNWLSLLAQAAQAFLESQIDQNLPNKRLFHAGRMYGSQRLFGNKKSPYFGLTQTGYVFELIKGQEGKIKFLRDLMRRQSKWKDHLIIRYVSEVTGQEEFASVFPCARGRAVKRTNEGTLRVNSSYQRWIKKAKPDEAEKFDDTSIRNDVFMGHNENSRTSEAFQKEEEIHGIFSKKKGTSPEEPHYESRVKDLEALGETVLFAEDENLRTVERSSKRPGTIRIIWGHTDEITDNSNGNEDWNWDPQYGEVHHFSPLFGDATGVTLFLRMYEAEPHIPDTMDFESLYDICQSNNVDLEALPYAFSESMRSNQECCRSLRAVATMHQIYKPLQTATLAIKLVELKYALGNADWVPVRSSDRPGRDYVIESRETRNNPKETNTEVHLDVPNAFDEAFSSVYPEGHAANNIESSQFRKVFSVTETEYMAPFNLTIAQTFSCILLSDSGTFNIPSSHMENIMAISSGDSLFIARPLLSDPANMRLCGQKVMHVMGNIGRAGTALLQAPHNPRIRKIGVEQWTYISGEDWDGQRRDAFQDTSLHLWFSGSSLAIDGKHTALGEKDTELYILESVVSVHGQGTSGGGEWIADLDILKALKDPVLSIQNRPQPNEASKGPPSVNDPLPVESFETEEWTNDFDLSKDPPDLAGKTTNKYKAPPPPTAQSPPQNHCECVKHADGSYDAQHFKLTAIENWIELLETPFRSCIFLAHDNWQARQAATAISVARGRKTCVLSKNTCWACIAESYRVELEGEGVVTFIA